MDKYESIRAFTKVVEHGGFAAAARDLGLSRSAVNRYVIDLERELQVQLLVRSTRRVSPTETGLAFYDRCRVILADLEEAELAVTKLHEEPIGNLRINAPMSFGTLHLSDAVADFMIKYPRLHVELVLNDRFVDPIEEGFDITIRIAEPRVVTSLISREIAPIRRVICASPGYLEACGEPMHPDELRSHRCLYYGYEQSGSHWRLEGSDGLHSVQIGCVMWSNNGEALKDAAIKDQGIVLLPTFIVGSELQSGRLRTILEAYRPSESMICALYPRHRHLSAKVRLFTDFVAKRFEQPYWDLVE
jgi:DNA-binding transcriptional LysR family regulator